MTEINRQFELDAATRRTALAKEPGSDVIGLLCNLNIKLPDVEGSLSQREMSRIGGTINKLGVEIYDQAGITAGMSERFLYSTIGQFYQDIDNIIISNGFSLDQVRFSFRLTREERAQLYKDLLPDLYLALVELGYNDIEIRI